MEPKKFDHRGRFGYRKLEGGIHQIMQNFRPPAVIEQIRDDEMARRCRDRLSQTDVAQKLALLSAGERMGAPEQARQLSMTPVQKRRGAFNGDGMIVLQPIP